MVFSYGDIVNLYLRDEFYPSDMFETERRDTVIPAGTVMNTGAPISGTYIATRNTHGAASLYESARI